MAKNYKIVNYDGLRCPICKSIRGMIVNGNGDRECVMCDKITSPENEMNEMIDCDGYDHEGLMKYGYNTDRKTWK